jgi:hypothetical protein
MALEAIVVKAALGLVGNFPGIGIDILEVIGSIYFSDLMGTAESKCELQRNIKSIEIIKALIQYFEFNLNLL